MDNLWENKTLSMRFDTAVTTDEAEALITTQTTMWMPVEGNEGTTIMSFTYKH